MTQSIHYLNCSFAIFNIIILIYVIQKIKLDFFETGAYHCWYNNKEEK